MRIRDLNWLQLEEYLRRDDRIVLPLGSTEQHAYLSLETDNLLAERAAVEAAEPLGVPVLPVLPYGMTGFTAFPGSPTLRLATYCAVLRDLLDSFCAQGFRRIVLVNGHGGNTPARAAVVEWAVANGDARVVWHELWDGRPDELAAEIDPEYDHASWSENLPWTRLPDVQLPEERKAPIVPPPPIASPEAWREVLGDGSFGGPYQVPDEDVLRVWAAAVEELRRRLEGFT